MTALPPGITSSFVEGVNGLRMHVLQAGKPGHPVVLLLHGFPELAYSWRKVMPALGAAGFHVVAPDQRGYGQTTGWDPAYDGDVDSFRLLNLVHDVLALLDRLGSAPVTAVVGHDFGASVAGCCALIRPDRFPRLVLMSAPFTGPPALGSTGRPDPIHAALAALPRPRKHYQWFYSEPGANADLSHPPQGLPAFLRAYAHMKSADWPNDPHPLPGWSAESLAVMPTYYIMDHAQGMAATVAPHAPASAAPWLNDEELAVYAGAYASTGFQGALNWYRCRTEGRNADLEVFAGRTIDVPALFIAGRQDWGPQQIPGALAAMQRTCPQMPPPLFIDGAGHWVQQEQPEAVIEALLGFLA